ncbi:MAG: hypothetical protein WCS73_02205 [Lentisphaeria bacterium]
MIPSDHFVRFYNEVFKELNAMSGLSKYYLEIAKLQEKNCLENFKKNGLKGVYNYYEQVKHDENCIMDIELEGHCLILRMNVCPSLSKAVDNDAGVFPGYCNHCPGWVLPLYTKAGLYDVYDIMGRKNPQCCEYIYDDFDLAKKKYAELSKTNSPTEILKNW